MGRISDIIPPLYYDAENDLIRYTDCLDVEIAELESKIKGITDLINVDKCPDDKLPYLAAMTNCPLMGDDASLWRKQIKNWPYLLKIKGTALSLEVFLNTIDVDEHKIYTFFRDADGNLVENKPDGEPFKKDDGLWYNIRTHYFDLDIIYNEGHFLSWREWHDDFLRNINIWMTRFKPFHSELRRMNVFLEREDELHLTIGTLGSEGIYHDIDFEYNTAAEDINEISVASIVNQGITHEIKHEYNSNASDKNFVTTGNILFTGIYHEIL